MTLNDAFDFVGLVSADHQAAFARHFGVHRVLVRQGTDLFKLTEHGLVFHGAISPGRTSCA